MCGIFGMFGAFTPDQRIAGAHAAVRLMRHRGPDDFGILDCGEGVLVNRRLAIVDLSAAGHQPMTSSGGQVHITFNGEIYNHVELAAELANGYRFTGHSDTEVLLAAYARWGDGFLDRLRGMFAIALWDERRRRLLCATDRLSIKPVLFVEADGRLVVSSEVKPIAASGLRLEVDERRLFEYFRFGLLDHSADTLFRHVHQLRPGTFFTWHDGRLEVHEYWDLATRTAAGHAGAPSEESIGDALEYAVDLHLRGDVEPALSLSAGLDSQVLRALIQRDGRAAGLHCFTHCYPGTPYDECAPARRQLGAADVQWHGTDITPEGLLPQLDELVHAMEGPVGGLGIYGYWQNCRTVASHGLKVLVDGQGADEAFAGYRYYYGALLAGLETRGDSATMAVELAAFNAAHHTALTVDSPGLRQLLTGAGGDGVLAPDGTSLASDFLSPSFAAAWSAHRPDALPAPFGDGVKDAMYRDLMFLKIPKLLRFQDRAAMASSVEVRVPFLDHVLLELLARVPSAQLVSGGITKSLLRRIAADRFGLQLDEPKRYVSAPQREWLKGPLRAGARAIIHDSSMARAGYVSAEALSAQYDAYCASPDLGNSFFIWKFLTLEFWYRHFILDHVHA